MDDSAAADTGISAGHDADALFGQVYERLKAMAGRRLAPAPARSKSTRAI